MSFFRRGDGENSRRAGEGLGGDGGHEDEVRQAPQVRCSSRSLLKHLSDLKPLYHPDGGAPHFLGRTMLGVHSFIAISSTARASSAALPVSSLTLARAGEGNDVTANATDAFAGFFAVIQPPRRDPYPHHSPASPSSFTAQPRQRRQGVFWVWRHAVATGRL